MKKIKLTLDDDTTQELGRSEVESITQDMGDIRLHHETCGIHPLFGPMICPDCKAKGNDEGCGKYFVYREIRGEPSLVEVVLKSGEVVYARGWEWVEDD